MGNGHGMSLFSRVVKKADGWARRSSHGVGSGALGAGAAASGFFASDLDELPDDEDGFGSGGGGGSSATILFHIKKKLGSVYERELGRTVRRRW